jgi:hypothetical protein
MNIDLRLALFALGATLLIIGGCQRSSPPDTAKPSADQTKAEDGGAEKASEGVSLTSEQVEKIGLRTQDAKATSHADEAAGYGTVIPHESIAQAVADLTTAAATERQSQSALARTKRLAGTAGALSSDVEDTAVRQAAVDTAALNLARRRLSASFGQKSPWSGGGSLDVLASLASGSTQLVRVTFPLGTLSNDVPKSLYVSRIGSLAGGKRWKMAPVWAAPGDASVPGRSFFAILRNSEIGEGERVIAWAPVGSALPGILVPTNAVIVSEGKYWCYIEKKPGNFVRTQINADISVDDGFFITGPVQPGDKLVTNGAAQLLAQESNSGADAE